MHKIKKLETVECTQVKRLLDDFLSDELSVETNRQILAHLEFCPDCSEERRQRVDIRVTLKNAWESVSAPTDFQQRIEAETRTKRNSLSIPFRVAAALLITMLSVVTYFSLIENDLFHLTEVQVVDHYRQIAFDHLRCTGRPTDDSPLALHQKEIEAQLGQLPGAYNLVGIMDCNVEGASFIHYVFRGDSGLLSLMLEARDENQLLPAKGATFNLSGTEIRMIHEGPLVVASLATPGYFVYIVGDGFDSEGTIELTRQLLFPVREALIASS